MAKRFTDTEKWSRPWYRSLPSDYRHLWNYLLDNCDHAGIWYVDIGLASYLIEAKLDRAKAQELFAKQIVPMGDGSRWWIRDFVTFQYGEFSKGSKVHQAVLRTLTRHGLAWPKATPCPAPRVGPTLGQAKAYPQGNGKGGRQGNSEGKGAGIRSVGVRTAVAA